MRLVFREALVPTAAGLTLGFYALFLINRIARTFVYGVPAPDAITLASASGILVAVITARRVSAAAPRARRQPERRAQDAVAVAAAPRRVPFDGSRVILGHVRTGVWAAGGCLDRDCGRSSDRARRIAAGDRNRSVAARRRRSGGWRSGAGAHSRAPARDRGHRHRHAQARWPWRRARVTAGEAAGKSGLSDHPW